MRSRIEFCDLVTMGVHTTMFNCNDDVDDDKDDCTNDVELSYELLLVVA